LVRGNKKLAPSPNLPQLLHCTLLRSRPTSYRNVRNTLFGPLSSLSIGRPKDIFGTIGIPCRRSSYSLTISINFCTIFRRKWWWWHAITQAHTRDAFEPNWRETLSGATDSRQNAKLQEVCCENAEKKVNGNVCKSENLKCNPRHLDCSATLVGYRYSCWLAAAMLSRHVLRIRRWRTSTVFRIRSTVELRHLAHTHTHLLSKSLNKDVLLLPPLAEVFT